MKLADNQGVMAQLMKLSKFAEQHNISYGTAYKHWTKGLLKGKKLSTNTILVEGYFEDLAAEEVAATLSDGVNAILYARVKKTKSPDVDNQAAGEQLAELEEFATASGYEVVDKTGDIGMSLDPNRRKFTEVLNRNDWDVLVVKNREVPMLTGVTYLEAALAASGRRIEYVEQLDSNAENVTLNFIRDTQHLIGLVYGVSKKNIREALERLTS